MVKVIVELCAAETKVLNFNINTKKSANRLTTKALVCARLELLETYWTNYVAVDRRMVCEAESNQAVAEYERIHAYDDIEYEFIMAKGELKTMLEQFDEPQRLAGHEAPRHDRIESVRMKPIETPSFSGEIEDWVSFRDLFDSIVIKNGSLSDVHRLQHLKIACKGKAAELIKHIQVTSANFAVAWDELTKRYENNRLLVSRMLERFLDLPAMSKECPIELARLIDGTSQAMRSLGALRRPTEHWDDILVVQTTRKLDLVTRLAWEKSIGSTTEMPKYAALEAHLNGVLRSFEAVRSCERVQTASTPSSNNRRSVRAHVVGTRDACYLCRGAHGLYRCQQFLAKNVAERRQFVERNGICYNCIATNRHVSRDCGSTYKCGECRRHHHTLLHGDDDNGVDRRADVRQGTSRVNPFSTPASASPISASPANASGTSVQTVSSNVCHRGISEEKDVVLLATAWVMATGQNGNTVRLRALIDQGSQATFVTEDAVQRLSIRKTPTSVVVIGIGEKSSGETYTCAELSLTSCLGMSRRINVKALILPTLTSRLPQHKFARSSWPHLANIPLADQTFEHPGRIDLLIGADVFADVLLDGVKHGKSGEPVAQQTVFGWIVSGRVMLGQKQPSIVTSLHVCLDDLLRKFWDEEEVPRATLMSAGDTACEALYAATTTRSSDGRYVVRLPFKDGDQSLGETRMQAVRRLQQMEKRFRTNNELFEGYKAFMATYLKLGHMERVAEQDVEREPKYYLPHHAVLKPESTTTKLRVVFDASLTSSNGVGLNERMLVGPRLQENLSAILQRWRLHRYAISADIEKMYRQIWVAPEHCDYQRILWRDNDQKQMQEYRLKTVTYGTACAPYLAVKTLQRLADDERKQFPWASKVLKNDFYVDDCLSGADTIEGALILKTELLGIAKAGGLRLLKWSSNCDQVLQSLPADHRECRHPLNINDDDTIKALGIRWHPAADEFGYKVSVSSAEQRTKRAMLSEISKLFDPLGFLAPTIIQAKIIMQQLWLTGLGWDDMLPLEICDSWKKFKGELVELEKIRVPRWLGHGADCKSAQIHGFSDASKLAYSACVYARIVRRDGQIAIRLLAAKTKVAPIHQQTIPRLELNGAVLLCKLVKECTNSTQFKTAEVFAWTDSTVVLAWLRRHANQWPTYIANRVSAIHTCACIHQWYHVAGTDNPADVASRGIRPSELHSHNLWWTGPSWLQKEQSDWPKQEELVVDSTLLEQKRSVRCEVAEVKEIFDLANRYSSWTRLIRITAYCKRVVKTNRRADRVLVVDEMERAIEVWIRLTQENAFGKLTECNRSSKLRKLSPFVDTKGLVRVGGRLENANIPYDERHPYILPAGSPITTLVIRDAHERMMHSGFQSTMGHLYQKYWVLNGKREVKRVIRNCVICAKARPKLQQQIMGNLPRARVSANRPFLHTGLDYAGPIWTRTTKGRGHKAMKSWIAVFICFSSKAVHLELVSDVSTASFIAAFKRFVSRRGICSDIYCDNGTNFVGADRELQRDMVKCVTDEEWAKELCTSGTRFHFAPPGSPHFNGLAEAGVKMAKTILRKLIGDHKLTFEEMMTFLAQVEAVLNSRPICAIESSNLDETTVLTPGHFLIGTAITAVPEPNRLDLKVSACNRWHLIQRMLQQFWAQWSREYLHRLQQKQKWDAPNNNIRVGDVVIVNEDTGHPTRWKMGRVVETHEGADGVVRVVTLKTGSSLIKRAIVKISVLPVDTNNDM